MKKKFFLIVLATIVLIILFTPIHRLELIEEESGRVLKSFPIKNGEEFTVYFIHSVERTPWYEIYYIKNDKDIYLKETVFYSFGAGLPSTTSHDFSFDDGGMKITNYNTKMDHLVYKVGAIIADHTFVIRGEEYHLDEIAEPFTSIFFRAEKMFLFKFLIREVANIV